MEWPNGLSYPIVRFYVDRISDIFVFYFKHWLNFYQNTWGVGILDMYEREPTFCILILAHAFLVLFWILPTFPGS